MESVPGTSGRSACTDNAGFKRMPSINIKHSQIPRRKQQFICQADPALMQEVIMGGAVVSAVGAALVSGLKGDAVVCEGCAGSGGILCFACSGSGAMEGVTLAEIQGTNPNKRDPLGRKIDKRECVACKGCGKLLCKRCNGSGYR